MIRVKDPGPSLEFYKEVMGMTLLRTSENASNGFNLYFLGYPGDEGIPKDSENGISSTATREGLLVRFFGDDFRSTYMQARIPPPLIRQENFS